MAFSNKAELRTAVLAWLGLVNGEIADSVVDRWIGLCEADLNRRTRLLSRAETGEIALTVSTSSYDVLTGFRQLVEVYLATTPPRRVLLRDIAQVRAAQAALAAGPPKFVAVKGDTDFDVAFVFAPVPDTAYTARVTYWRQIGLESDTDTNAILTQHPDAYLYGTLLHAEGYLGNDPRIANWQDLYLEQIASIAISEKANEKSDQGAPA